MKRQTIINALSSSGQFVVIGVSIYFLYKFLLVEIGVEKLGLWSVVIAITTATNIAGLGLGGGVVKFVAQYLSHDDTKTVALLIETAFVSIGIFIGILLIPLNYVFRFFLGRIARDALFLEMKQILPIVLVSFWLFNLGQVLWSGIDGYQRIDIRNMASTVINGFVYVWLAFLLTPRYGLLGLAYAFLFRGLLSLIVGGFVFRKLCSEISILPHRWNLKLFKEMLAYGISFQFISIAQMLVDPTTKFFMAKFGSLEIVGYYELAYTMVMQLRGILISANSVIVPIVADLQERSHERVHELFLNSMRLMVIISLPFYGMILALTPVVSWLWIGRYEFYFILFSWVISLSFLINNMASPAYFMNLGTGKLKLNVLSHVSITAIALGLGYLLGSAFGGLGVAVSYAMAISVGSLYLVIGYSRNENISLRLVFTSEDGFLLIITAVFLICVMLIYYCFSLDDLNIMIQVSAIFIVFILIYFIPLWRHPMRKKILHWVLQLMLSADVTHTKDKSSKISG